MREDIHVWIRVWGCRIPAYWLVSLVEYWCYYPFDKRNEAQEAAIEELQQLLRESVAQIKELDHETNQVHIIFEENPRLPTTHNLTIKIYVDFLKKDSQNYLFEGISIKESKLLRQKVKTEIAETVLAFCNRRRDIRTKRIIVTECSDYYGTNNVKRYPA